MLKLATQIAASAVALVGLALAVSVPVAMIVGGLFVVAVIEVR